MSAVSQSLPKRVTGKVGVEILPLSSPEPTQSAAGGSRHKSSEGEFGVWFRHKYSGGKNDLFLCKNHQLLH
jgi:hypothetical protein